MLPNPVFLDTFKAVKANPVPMPFAELYGALEAKAVAELQAKGMQ